MYQFPATDFHELNLDWMLQQIKAITAEWGQEQTNLNTWKENTQELIDAYLEVHCSDAAVRARVSEELTEMVEDGIFGRYLILGKFPDPGTLRGVYDGQCRELFSRKYDGK